MFSMILYIGVLNKIDKSNVQIHFLEKQVLSFIQEIERGSKNGSFLGCGEVES